MLDAAGLKALVAQHRGKVVLLDFWATWCAPCVKGLPNLAVWQDRYKARGFQVIPVSFDDPRDWRRKALPVLRRAGWRGTAVVMNGPDARNEVVDWLGSKWRSDLPAQFILDAEGQVIVELLAINKDENPPIETIITDALKTKSNDSTGEALRR